jgi:hypothetical protein
MRDRTSGLERSVASLAITCIVIFGAWGTALYVIHVVKPRHVRIKAMLGGIASIDFEANGGEAAGEKGAPPGTSALSDDRRHDIHSIKRGRSQPLN